jgi:hypothetical protein
MTKMRSAPYLFAIIGGVLRVPEARRTKARSEHSELRIFEKKNPKTPRGVTD